VRVPLTPICSDADPSAGNRRTVAPDSATIAPSLFAAIDCTPVAPGISSTRFHRSASAGVYENIATSSFATSAI
jgi:hypothetical protein